MSDQTDSRAAREFEVLGDPWWLLGDATLLTRPGVALVGGRRLGAYGERVAEVVASAARASGAPLWVRLSPSGVERAAVGAAWEAGVAVVALAAGGFDQLPAERVDEVLATGGAVLCAQPHGPASAASVRRRDEVLGAHPSVLVPVDAVEAPDVAVVLESAVLARTPLVVARPRVGHRRGPEAALAQALAVPGRAGRLRLGAEASRRLGRHEVAANAVCDTPEGLESAVGFLLRWAHTGH